MHGFQIQNRAVHSEDIDTSNSARGEHAVNPQQRSPGNACKYLCDQYDSMYFNYSQLYSQLIDPLSEPNTQGVIQKSQCWFNDYTGQINNHKLHGDVLVFRVILRTNNQ